MRPGAAAGEGNEGWGAPLGLWSRTRQVGCLLGWLGRERESGAASACVRASVDRCPARGRNRGAGWGPLAPAEGTGRACMQRTASRR